MTMDEPAENREGLGLRRRAIDLLFAGSPRESLVLTLMIGLFIVLVDLISRDNVSLGPIYIIPIMVAAPHLRRWHLVLVSVLIALVREALAPERWDSLVGTRMVLTILAYLGVGFLTNEMARNRRLSMAYITQLREEVRRREEAEGQLRSIIDSSPAAILTTDDQGKVDLANRAANELFGYRGTDLAGRRIGEFLPVVEDLLRYDTGASSYRAATTCRGKRATGELFQACVWFSTYSTPTGKRLAAIVTDTSEDLRDWQETSFQSLLRSTRVLVGSVSHEIRNICAAIGLVHANLGRIPEVAATEDYAALGTLAAGLARVATVELNSASEREPSAVDLGAVLDELAIVLEPDLEAHGIEFLIHRESSALPMVCGEHHGLLQVFLNVIRNSIRALESAERKSIEIRTSADDDSVLVKVSDSGPGVQNPERLFQPFQTGADAVGLGLFVSRAIVRASSGELYHLAGGPGCTMCVRLRTMFSLEPSLATGEQGKEDE